MEIYETKATFDTFEEVVCDMPPHYVINRDPDETPGSPSVIYHVRLEQDDVRSNEAMVVVYDDVCMECAINSTEASAQCSQKVHVL